MENNMRRSVKRGVRVMCLVLCAGVVCTVGCGRNTKVEASTTTVGQELKDLEDARNRGLLTEDEYAKQREAILKRK